MSESNRGKVARCLIGAESIRRGVIPKTADSDVLLAALKYLAASTTSSSFENTLLDVAATRPELLQQVLMFKPTKTLEVGYLQVR